ncbi:MAG: hypothetical protein EZS28_021114 [Streblomastix strix]|uniref:Protein kinase domain-containing protein n=1 Tax=Streblomastix strix TaxID=222440 RepID=A0A5J4VLX1_9EUKA|nr:MAG: hypothetical protein EZS28_021114 [Streblomastix strix]
MYMVMEYCENGDLRKVISELQQVPEEERRECGIFGQMIRTLDFLHCNGIIHLDINRANIFVMIDGLTLVWFEMLNEFIIQKKNEQKTNST